MVDEWWHSEGSTEDNLNKKEVIVYGEKDENGARTYTKHWRRYFYTSGSLAACGPLRLWRSRAILGATTSFDWNAPYTDLGHVQCQTEETIFYKRFPDDTVLLYGLVTDDFLITGSETRCAEFRNALTARFKCRDYGLVSEFTNLKITRDANGSVIVSQTHYIHSILKKYGFTQARGKPTPMDSTIRSVPDPSTSSFNEVYQEQCGSLLYLAVTSRPDLLYTVRFLCTRMTNPSDVHLRTIRRLFQYLAASADLELIYHGGDCLDVTVYCDSDWASGLNGKRRSVSGYTVMLGR
eukprot:scaffold4127_cov386-Pinguiococcus_pyrenoidosus.AAC.1